MPSIRFALLFIFIGAQFVGLGLLGEYIGRIYDEVKKRPFYIVGNRVNFTSVNASEHGQKEKT